MSKNLQDEEYFDVDDIEDGYHQQRQPDKAESACEQGDHQRKRYERVMHVDAPQLRPTELGKRARPSSPRILRCYRSAPGRLGRGSGVKRRVTEQVFKPAEDGSFYVEIPKPNPFKDAEEMRAIDGEPEIAALGGGRRVFPTWQH